MLVRQSLRLSSRFHRSRAQACTSTKRRLSSRFIIHGLSLGGYSQSTEYGCVKSILLGVQDSTKRLCTFRLLPPVRMAPMWTRGPTIPMIKSMTSSWFPHRTLYIYARVVEKSSSSHFWVLVPSQFDLVQCGLAPSVSNISLISVHYTWIIDIYQHQGPCFRIQLSKALEIHPDRITQVTARTCPSTLHPFCSTLQRQAGKDCQLTYHSSSNEGRVYRSSAIPRQTRQGGIPN